MILAVATFVMAVSGSATAKGLEFSFTDREDFELNAANPLGGYTDVYLWTPGSSLGTLVAQRVDVQVNVRATWARPALVGGQAIAARWTGTVAVLNNDETFAATLIKPSHLFWHSGTWCTLPAQSICPGFGDSAIGMLQAGGVDRIAPPSQGIFVATSVGWVDPQVPHWPPVGLQHASVSISGTADLGKV